MIDLKSITTLNHNPKFWGTYCLNPGMVRRRKLLELFKESPQAKIPVNRAYQANLCDPDLQYFIKRGILKRIRQRKESALLSGARQT